MNLELPEGDYYIIPLTSGCTLGRPSQAQPEDINMLDEAGNLHPLVELAVKDIFLRLIYRARNYIDYQGFAAFYERLDLQIT